MRKKRRGNVYAGGYEKKRRGGTGKAEKERRKALRPHVKGFPKLLPCLICSKDRKSTWPGDRLHRGCRTQRSEHVAAEFILRAAGSYQKED